MMYLYDKPFAAPPTAACVVRWYVDRIINLSPLSVFGNEVGKNSVAFKPSK